MTRSNDSSSATSTFNLFVVVAPIGARRVHRRTLSLSGSPEATPSGKRSRRSRQETLDDVAKASPQTDVAPRAIPISMNARPLIVVIGPIPSLNFGSCCGYVYQE